MPGADGLNPQTDFEAMLREIVDRIVRGFSPRKIILFGSRARGTPAADSDVDLVVVTDRPGSRRQQAVATTSRSRTSAWPKTSWSSAWRSSRGIGTSWERSPTQCGARGSSSMTARPETLRAVRRWIAKAEEDLAAAERLLSLDDSLAAVVCFHAQQAVEKAAQGAPRHRRRAVRANPRRHPARPDVAPRTGLAGPSADLAPLNRYAVEARYPINEEPLTGDEARDAIALARRVREAVLRVVGPTASA